VFRERAEAACHAPSALTEIVLESGNWRFDDLPTKCTRIHRLHSNFDTNKFQAIPHISAPDLREKKGDREFIGRNVEGEYERNEREEVGFTAYTPAPDKILESPLTVW